MMNKIIIFCMTFFWTPGYMICGNTPSKASTDQQTHQIIVPSKRNTKTNSDDDNNGPQVVNFNTTFSPNISPIITGNASSNATSISQSTAYVYVSNKIKNMVKMIQNLTAADISHGMQQCLCAYKWHLLVAIPTTTYLSICAFLVYVNTLMNNQTNWIQWKYHLTIEELNASYEQQKEQQEMRQQLVRSILKRHLNATQPTNHISPLVTFIMAVDRELKLITHYIRLAHVLKLSHLIAIFPINEEKITKAKLAKQRLEFIKKLFIDWTATHNLEQFLHATPVADPAAVPAA